jgi:hypothetical protein
VISRHTARLRQVLPARSRPRLPAQGSEPAQESEAVPANTPGRDNPTPLDPDSLLARLVHLAQAAEQAGPHGLVIDTPQSRQHALQETWQAYAGVVDVLGAITRSARLIEMGVCVASQLAALDLLNAELEVVWSRWDKAQGKVIGQQARRAEP